MQNKNKQIKKNKVGWLYTDQFNSLFRIVTADNGITLNIMYITCDYIEVNDVQTSVIAAMKKVLVGK